MDNLITNPIILYVLAKQAEICDLIHIIIFAYFCQFCKNLQSIDVKWWSNFPFGNPGMAIRKYSVEINFSSMTMPDPDPSLYAAADMAENDMTIEFKNHVPI